MMYVGFAITMNEALRLLKLSENTVSSLYDTKPIRKYLESKNSYLSFEYIDKGVCLLGVKVEVEEKYADFPYTNIDDTFFAVMRSKYIFQREVDTLDIDITYVNITWIESKEIHVEHPQPYVISI